MWLRDRPSLRHLATCAGRAARAAALLAAESLSQARRASFLASRLGHAAQNSSNVGAARTGVDCARAITWRAASLACISGPSKSVCIHHLFLAKRNPRRTRRRSDRSHREGDPLSQIRADDVDQPRSARVEIEGYAGARSYRASGMKNREGRRRLPAAGHCIARHGPARPGHRNRPHDHHTPSANQTIHRPPQRTDMHLLDRRKLTHGHRPILSETSQDSARDIAQRPSHQRRPLCSSAAQDARS